MKYILYLIVIVAFFANCQDEKVEAAKYQFKAYYYPIEELSQGKVYVYTPVNNDSLESYFWYFIQQGGYLIGTKYNSQLQVEQITTEDILKNGTALHRMRLCDYFENEPDICQPIDVTVESPAVFPFEMRDSSSVFLYKINWNELTNPNTENEIIRNRHFSGFETIEWKGNLHEAIRFTIREEISSGSQEDGFQTFKALTEEVYAKNIGLVYYKKNIENIMNLEYQLADTTNMKTLENMFQESRID